MTVKIDGLSLKTNFTSHLNENKQLQLDLLDLYMDFEHPGALINIDGINDFG